MKKSLYDILGVTPEATPAEIESSAQQLKVRLSGPNAPPDAKIRLIAVSEAYEVLSDATKKSLYDQRRRMQQLESLPQYTEVPLIDQAMLVDHTRDAVKRLFGSGRVLLALALLAAVLIYSYNLQAHRKDLLNVAKKIEAESHNKVLAEEYRNEHGVRTPEEIAAQKERQVVAQKKREDEDRLSEAERQQQKFHSELNKITRQDEQAEREKERKRQEKLYQERMRREQERMQNEAQLPQRGPTITYVP